MCNTQVVLSIFKRIIALRSLTDAHHTNPRVTFIEMRAIIRLQMGEMDEKQKLPMKVYA